MSKEMHSKNLIIMDLIEQLKSGQINRDAEMQRSYVWGVVEQTEFIDSMFQSEDTYIPPIIGAESEADMKVGGKLVKVMDLLDGKQRSTTIERFLNNEIKLGNNIKPVIIKQEDGTNNIHIITGLTWKDIPEEAKIAFKANKIQMVYFKGMSFEDRERQFIKLQGGKKLSNAEVNKVRVGHEIREFIYKQLGTDLWAKKTTVSSNREVKFETMQQVLMVMTNQFDLSGKSLHTFSENCSIADSTLGKVILTTEYLNDVAKIIKKIELQKLDASENIENLTPKQLKKYGKPIDFLKKVNVPIIYNVAIKAIENDINAEQFANFISKFFGDIPFNYKRIMESGSAEAEKVKGRINILDEALTKEFNIIEKVAEDLGDDDQEEESDDEENED